MAMLSHRKPSVSMPEAQSQSSIPLDSKNYLNSHQHNNTYPSNEAHTKLNLPPPQPTDSINSPATPATPNWWIDRHSIFLLITLYTAQGLPMGLAFGAIPFLLKEKGASYGDIAKFSFAGLPYSMKLLIAPIVDSLYFKSFGRRKSWIVPVQFIISALMLTFSNQIHQWVLEKDVGNLTPMFLLFISLTATQDIAVDGWSLTMLKRQNVAYASTCQSLGLSIGFFATFTIFLSFSNDSFCDQYVRPLLLGNVRLGKGGLIDLEGALKLVGLFYLMLTVYIAVGKKEVPTVTDKKKSDGVVGGELEQGRVDEGSGSLYQNIMSTYSDMFFALRLSAVKSLVFCLLIAKVGVSAHDNVTPLKLLELGFSKEKMASMAVLQTPFSLLGTLIAGRWVSKRSPIRVYLIGWTSRIILSLFGPLCVLIFKQMNGVVTPWFYTFVLILGILYSFASECLMFIGAGAFFLTITSSSVHVAGSYLSLLNTSSNMGGMWHKALVLWLVDKLTITERHCLKDDCNIIIDGFYIISAILIPIAIFVGIHLFKTLPKLEKLPDSAWRAGK